MVTPHVVEAQNMDATEAAAMAALELDCRADGLTLGRSVVDAILRSVVDTAEADARRERVVRSLLLAPDA